MSIRRICFFAGPGVGKSTLASRVFAELKIRGHDVEHIGEYVKQWAHEGRFPTSYDQLYLFGKQLHREDVALRHVKTIVTDCPILMSAAYARFYGFRGYVELIALAHQFDDDFQPLNFYIERTVEYNDKGRYQNLEEAKRFDAVLQDTMFNLKFGYEKITVDQVDQIVATIEEKLGKDSE